MIENQYLFLVNIKKNNNIALRLIQNNNWEMILKQQKIFSNYLGWKQTKEFK